MIGDLREQMGSAPTARIGTRLAGSDNALNAIRLVLACAVIVAHSWPLGGFGVAPTFARMDGGTWAVGGFFAISGYLIAGSRLRLSFRQYLLRRALRIYPGFWMCLVVVAFGFAPLSAMLGAPGRWSLAGAFDYLAQNCTLVMRAFNVETTIHDNPFPDTWDGSLWTLGYEFAAYLAVGALFGIAIVRRQATVCFALILAATTIGYHATGVLHISNTYLIDGSSLATFFASGVLLHSVGDRLPSSQKLCAASVTAILLIGFCGLPHLLVALPFAYVLLYTGSIAPSRIGSKNDVSYGLYVYAFPVQQLLAAKDAQRFGVIAFMTIALALTVPLAWLSWKLVEHPAMRLRRRLNTSP